VTSSTVFFDVCVILDCHFLELFSLAHNLVDLYPNLAISWFAVGCYYYIIGKSDYARRYLAKATCLDRLFGPAWLAYGHSFAIENEHDQAMAAYFKASQLMKGCHLPLLYIGLECGLTNNIRLAEKFFKQAQNIAPDDPFVMHEMGVIAFQNMKWVGRRDRRIQTKNFDL
jgi:anaphase-promoting complex subunit 6